MSQPVISITTAADLAGFRSRELAGSALLAVVTAAKHPVLTLLPPGVGKSYGMDNLTAEAILTKAFDLVVVLTANHAIIGERRFIHEPPQDINVVHLKGRPTHLCGPAQNNAWSRLEPGQLYALGRQDICLTCPGYAACYWPLQWQQGLEGAQLVYAPQAYLKQMPGFILHLKRSTKAEKMLVLFDEVDFSAVSFKKRIPHKTLRTFHQVLRRQLERGAVELKTWCYQVETLLQARQQDLDSNDWWFHPLGHQTIASIQRLGWQLYGSAFCYIGSDLEIFGSTPGSQRQSTHQRDLEFSTAPWLAGKVMIFSGTANPDFLSYRLGVPIATHLADVRVSHPDSRFYNLAINHGMRCHFESNAPQILDFFDGLIRKRLAAGVKVALVSRLPLVNLCTHGLNERLHCAGLHNWKVVTAGQWQLADDKQGLIPVLHYGLIGINDFTDFDAIYCLNGFYLPTEVISDLLQETLPYAAHIPLQIVTTHPPRRRRVVEPVNLEDSIYREFLQLGQSALHQQELGVVAQAIFRARPATSSCEVILMQCGQLPGVTYDMEFDDLTQARNYFGLITRRTADAALNAQQIRALQQRGLTQKQIGGALGLSRSTVQRAWISPRSSTSEGRHHETF